MLLTSIQQLLPNLFKSRSPKLVQTGSWKPSLCDSVPEISDVVYFIFGAAKTDEHLCSSTCRPGSLLRAPSVCPAVFFHRFIHHLNVPFLPSLAPIQEVIAPPGVHSLIVFAAVLFRTCGPERRSGFACGDGHFAGTSALVVQMNVLSFDVLTVHVLIN